MYTISTCICIIHMYHTYAYIKHYKTICDRQNDDVFDTLLRGFLESTSAQAARRRFGHCVAVALRLGPCTPCTQFFRSTDHGRLDGSGAVYFLLKQSGITTKCNATKHALSSPWPRETFTRSRIASMKVSALHLQMLCGYLVRMMPAATSFETCQQFCDGLKTCSW